MVNKNKKTSNVPMPKATATWLAKNAPSITPQQISDFCGISLIDAELIKLNPEGTGVAPFDPTKHYLSWDEIERCQANPNLSLKPMPSALDGLDVKRPKEKKYVSMMQRRNKVECILWLVSFAPMLTDRQIVRLIGTTKSTIEKIRNKTHKDYNFLTPKSPVIAGIVLKEDLNQAIELAKKNSQGSETTSESSNKESDVVSG